MTLRFLGKDPDSPNNGSPTIYESGDTYLVQGWRVTDTNTLAELGALPEGEAIVAIPKRMVQFFPEINGDASGHLR